MYYIQLMVTKPPDRPPPFHPSRNKFWDPRMISTTASLFDTPGQTTLGGECQFHYEIRKYDSFQLYLIGIRHFASVEKERSRELPDQTAALKYGWVAKKNNKGKTQTIKIK